MARRRNDSLLDALLNIATSISYKTSIPIAVVSYLVFHHYANQPITAVKDMGAMSDMAFQTAIVTFSSFLQYLIPCIFVIGAIVSIFKGKKRGKLLEQQTSLDSIRGMSWQNFEVLVGEAFRRKGFEVKENGGGGPDGGIDLVLTKAGKKSIVQCKRWKTASIGVKYIRELYGVMTAERANDCIFVSSGNYTAEARLFAEDKPIWLIDGEALLRLVTNVQVTPNSNAKRQIVEAGTTNPLCPKCGSSMVKRVAKRGANKGNEFWGCSQYPRCR